ncbi:MAG: hypothetical protein NVS9B1_00680 [Candidatus Dormibacteraceae bacterium]
MPRRLHAAVLPTLVAAVLFSLLALRAGAADGFHFFAPIQVGEHFARPSLLLPGQAPRPGLGQDGQFYFFIAQDPLLRNPETSAALDNTLRYRRILYPLVAFLLSLGHRGLLPPILIAVNVLAATATVAAGAVAANRAGRNPWSALALAAYPGLWIPLLLDMTEPLQVALLAWGMLTGSAGLLFLSALAKETTIVISAVEVFRAAVQRRWAAAARHTVAGAALGAWAIFVFATVHARESTLGGHLLDPPGAPFLALLRAHNPFLFAFTAAAVAICIVAVVRLAWIRDPAAWGGAVYSVVGLTAGIDTWQDPIAFYRVIAGSVVLLFLSWVVARDRAAAAALVMGVLAGAAALTAVLIASA